ncbi:MAG TPA: MFS transporter [Gemmatimonadaceae bacterium]|jgi:MFS family permease|nr:MFS transporter [Gemmatimonadaceae bacterium]
MSSSRNFRLYLAGATLSSIGTAMVPVALSFAVLNAGLRAGALGLVLAAQTIPTIGLLLIGGVIGDRWSRRRVMIGSDMLRCVAQIALAAALIGGSRSLWLIVSLTALVGVGNAFFGPASSGFLVGIVGKEDLSRANGALRTGTALAMIIGPSAAGLIVVGIGPGWTLGLDGLSYLASAVCLGLVTLGPQVPATNASKGRNVGSDLREGFRVFAQRRWLWLVVGQFGLLNLIAIAPFRVITPVLLATLPNGARAWGLLLGMVGAGALVGAIGVTRWKATRALVAVEIAVCALLPLLFLLAIGVPFPLLLAGAFAFGVGAAVLSVLTLTAIQREIPLGVLSRVMSVVQLADMGLTPLGYVLAAPAAALLGARGALASAATCVLLSVAVLLSFPDIRGFGAPSFRGEVVTEAS